MIIQQQIDDLVEWDGLKEFSRFVLSHCGDGGLPDYKKMDLMQVPMLIPHVWVYDLRDDEKKRNLLINFAGERHTDFFGRNVMGEREQNLDEFYSTYSEALSFFAEAAELQRSVYYRIFSKRDDERHQFTDYCSEGLYFPCSRNGTDVDWGIGCELHEHFIDVGKDVRIFL